MTRRIFCFVLSISLICSGQSLAQTEAADLALGIRQVDEGDLAAAIITLDGVVKKLTGVPARTNDLALAHLYLGVANLGMNQGERAKAEMREAWRLNKGLKLDPKKFPPRVIQAYEEAKAEATNAAKTASTAAPSPAGSPKATPTPAPKSGGSSKTLLIVGGVVAAGGAIAVAGGGGSKTSPTPAPTPRPTPQQLSSGSFNFVQPNVYTVQNITVPAAGTLQVTVNWTFSTSTFGLNIGQGAWPGTFGPFVASSPFTTSRPLTLNYTVNTAGTYCFYVFYVTGTAAESGTYQAVFTRQ